MSDSEYSSDDDEDYVPEADSASEEEGGPEEKTASEQKSVKKDAPKRKRKGGIKLEDDDDDENDDDEPSDQEDLDEQERAEKEKKKQEKDEQAKKARMEDLWASFKSDTTNVRAKPTNPTISSSTKALPSKTESTNVPKPKDMKPSSSLTKPSTSKVTITKTFDFAGEAVTVTKTVDANSIEAKKSQKQEEAKKEPTPSTSSPVVSVPSAKRKGGLGSILGQIGKKPKISTLEKSKLDWEHFKSERGIGDDLKNFNKNGYLERQDFLQRTDQRLFEKEKETRAAMRSNRS